MRARVVLGLMYLLALASPAPAEDRRPTPLDRLLPEIRRTTPGTFYDAEGPYPGLDGQMRYHLKWMTPDGRIVWFEVDARSGRVLNGQILRPQPHQFQDERDRFPGSGHEHFPSGGDRGDRHHDHPH